MLHRLPLLSILLSLVLTASLTMAVPTTSVRPSRFNTNTTTGVKVSPYLGPRYKYSHEFLIARQQALDNGTDYELPADLPYITVQPGTILDMSSLDNTTSPNSLAKRSGLHGVLIYPDVGCTGDPLLKWVDFGCNVGCVTINYKAHSARVYQEADDSPYPSMDVYGTAECQGRRLAHFGVETNDSCNDLRKASDFFVSFMGFFDCGV